MITLRTIVSRHPTPLVLKGKSVLIVEDEPLIALQTHAILHAAGASIIAATTAAEALALIQRADIAVAVLDIQLGDRDCRGLCRALSSRGVPFLFYTGYADADVLREWPNAPVLIKPAEPQMMLNLVIDLAGRSFTSL